MTERGGAELEAFSTSKHCDARFHALHASNKLEQDVRIFLAPHIERIPVAVGEMSGA